MRVIVYCTRMMSRPELVGAKRQARDSFHEGAGGYDPGFFDQLTRIEDEHFWFRARNHLIFSLVRKISPSLMTCNRVLEVGCGTGNVLRVLEKACPQSLVIGLELWSEGLKHARGRSSAALVQADIRNLPFGKPFGLVGMFDVLEHITDDRETLAAVWRCLAPGGKLLLTVPAHQSLWSYFDEAAHHCRRYSPASIREKILEAGFQIDFLSQFMACTFPLTWIYRKMRKQRLDPEAARVRAHNEFRIVPVVNPILTALLTIEAGWVARGQRLPIGTSLVVVASKAESL
jgi:SAM-dependent methyltransferase